MGFDVDNRKKGNLAERKVALVLESLMEIDSVVPISNQDDSNHWDIYVTLKGDHTVFAVQVKSLSDSNLSLKTTHINHWLDARMLTVPMWADESNGAVFWADILHKLIKVGGSKKGKSIRFNPQLDLNPLHQDNSVGTRSFVRWVRVFARIWPQLRRPSTAQFLLTPEFSTTLVDAIRDPSILAFLPTDVELILAIRDYHGKSEKNLNWLNNTIFQSARRALQSPSGAAAWLGAQLGIPTEDLAIMNRLVQSLTNWSEQISREAKAEISGTLWAYTQLAPMLSYEKTDDFRLPSFTSQYTWPMRSLMGLLPTHSLVEPLSQVLEHGNHADTLLHAAYYFGTLPFPSNARAWERIKT